MEKLMRTKLLTPLLLIAALALVAAPLAFGQGSYGGSYSGAYQQPAYGYGSHAGVYQQAPQAAYGSQGGYAGGYYSAPPVTYQAAPQVYSNVTYSGTYAAPPAYQAQREVYRARPNGSVVYRSVGTSMLGGYAGGYQGMTCVNGVCYGY